MGLDAVSGHSTMPQLSCAAPTAGSTKCLNPALVQKFKERCRDDLRDLEEESRASCVDGNRGISRGSTAQGCSCTGNRRLSTNNHNPSNKCMGQVLHAI